MNMKRAIADIYIYTYTSERTSERESNDKSILCAVIRVSCV